ncbi:hypothetical protein PGT21_027772 [Puccinia graminis f. sp. tritici]|uniref:Uncharacterized protein n=1 Tax=Puccinia graminis f. sp. tritici TaxID=56615 RepID=A0A5B0RTM4_PUCGR|nr:hypothetical protein PGT21_027772 [Puccinia graminis f. sp. tritici]KAA1128385.1 hypothetical protein PGTUg99_018851 [Puccinia graminis f. sp. tritici]
MSASPSELNAANALASMLSNPSPSPSGHSADSTLTELSEELVLPPIAELRPSSYLQANMGAILELGPSGLDDALGFVPLINSAPLTPTSLVSDKESDTSTENAPRAEENEDHNLPQEASEAGHPEPGTEEFSEVVPASHGYHPLCYLVCLIYQGAAPPTCHTMLTLRCRGLTPNRLPLTVDPSMPKWYKKEPCAPRAAASRRDFMITSIYSTLFPTVLLRAPGSVVALRANGCIAR